MSSNDIIGKLVRHKQDEHLVGVVTKIGVRESWSTTGEIKKESCACIMTPSGSFWIAIKNCKIIEEI